MSREVSLCVIRLEIYQESHKNYEMGDKEPEECGAMAVAADPAPGRRDPKDITVETFSRNDSHPIGLLLGSDEFQSFPPIETDGTRPKGLSESSGQDPGAKDQIHFISGNPFVEVTKGILHLFKENQLTDTGRATQRSQTICMLAVPATMTCHDLLTFTAACHHDIQHIRVLRDGSPNQYMALLTFRSQAAASEFFGSFNGAPFNSLEPLGVCHLVFVSRVEVTSEPDVPPPPGHTELPTCPVCLERMDESVDGILTILCNHSFHGNCLDKWGDVSCPVCRYVQTPELAEDSWCQECHSADSLWICLICGHIGCSRYVMGHASQHYQSTLHCYSMQLGTNHVWDYVGDNFVHRLLQNKTDGKLVEGTGPSKGVSEEKLESMQLEFSNLLTSQLDSQRRFFEERLSRAEGAGADATREAAEKAAEATEENEALRKKLLLLAREKITTDKKLALVTTKLSAALSELQDEKQMSKALQENQAVWQSKFTGLETQFAQYKTTKDKELTDMKEQLRDVMFFLEAQKICSESADSAEIATGRVTIGESPPEKPSRRRNKHR